MSADSDTEKWLRDLFAKAKQEQDAQAAKDAEAMKAVVVMMARQRGDS